MSWGVSDEEDLAAALSRWLLLFLTVSRCSVAPRSALMAGHSGAGAGAETEVTVKNEERDRCMNIVEQVSATPRFS